MGGVLTAPFFTIISTCRNAGSYARRSIESVLTQDFPSWELYFVDDASDDAVTGSFMRKAMKKAGHWDDRIHLIYNASRRWKLMNFLRCAKEAQGEVLVELDGDDWFSTPQALSTIHAAYQSKPTIEATAGSFHGFPTDKVVYAKTQPLAGHRFMQNGFCDSVPAPRTWKRALTERSLRELPELYLDPRTNHPWCTNSDIALFAPALFWAKDIAAIEDILVEVNWETTAHDDMLTSDLMKDEGERLYSWCLDQEWKWAEGQLRAFEKDGDKP